jgi:hypothetical protein
MTNIITKEKLETTLAEIQAKKAEKTKLIHSIVSLKANLEEKEAVQTFELARINGEERIIKALIAEINIPEPIDETTVNKEVEQSG